MSEYKQLKHDVDTYNELAKILKDKVEGFVRDPENDFDERWEMFCDYKVDQSNWVYQSKVLEDQMQGGLSWYDDFYIDRYESVDNVDVVEMLRDKVIDGELPESVIRDFQEEIMSDYTRFWDNDW